MSHADTNTYTNADTNAYAHANSDTDAYAYADANADANTHTYANADAHTDTEPDTNAYAQSDGNTYTKAYGYAHAYTYAYGGANAYTYGEPYADAHADPRGRSSGSSLVTDRRDNRRHADCRVIVLSFNAQPNKERSSLRRRISYSSSSQSVNERGQGCFLHSISRAYDQGDSAPRRRGEVLIPLAARLWRDCAVPA